MKQEKKKEKQAKISAMQADNRKCTATTQNYLLASLLCIFVFTIRRIFLCILCFICFFFFSLVWLDFGMIWLCFFDIDLVGVSFHFKWFYNYFHLLFLPLLIMRIINIVERPWSKSLIHTNNLYHQYLSFSLYLLASGHSNWSLCHLYRWRSLCVFSSLFVCVCVCLFIIIYFDVC